MNDDAMEETLDGLNAKVHALESAGASEELLEAYVNRSTILSSMGSGISAMSDTEEAAELIEAMAAVGTDVNVGTFVKVFHRLGSMSDGAERRDAYRRILPKLGSIDGTSRHFDDRRIVDMCLDCAFALRREDDAALEFLTKARRTIHTNDEPWALNRKVVIFEIMGNIFSRTDREDSEYAYGVAIDTGESLYAKNELEDPMDLVHALTGMGDICEYRSKHDVAMHHIRAAEILEENMTDDDDRSALSTIYRYIASALELHGRMGEAEMYMLKAARTETGR